MNFVDRLCDVETKFAAAMEHVSVEEATRNRELRKIGKSILQLLRLTEVFRSNKAASDQNRGLNGYESSSQSK
ncbi:MAG: hypothetical protein FJ146_15655 [Deltaproteobacteria bacterium]|nr:hypothetical protein [Deltaproteobacteria bacterium]